MDLLKFEKMSISNPLKKIQQFNLKLKINDPDFYEKVIHEIVFVAKLIELKKEKEEADGRINSAIKEIPFLEKMKEILLEKNPDWVIEIPKCRAFYDIMINSILINLKLTDCKSSDNCVNKRSIYYSITGCLDYPYSSTWNDFLEQLKQAQAAKQIKQKRNKSTEYHFLVKNKITGDVLLKPIFDIHTFISNPSNDLQINWKNEFKFKVVDCEYLIKVEELLVCVQNSVRSFIERTQEFANYDLTSLLGN